MSVSERTVRQGWAWPSGCDKAHYFYDVRSLCGRWAYFGSALEADFPSGKSPDQCKTCENKRLKERGIS